MNEELRDLVRKEVHEDVTEMMGKHLGKGGGGEVWATRYDGVAGAGVQAGICFMQCRCADLSNVILKVMLI